MSARFDSVGVAVDVCVFFYESINQVRVRVPAACAGRRLIVCV